MQTKAKYVAPNVSRSKLKDNHVKTQELWFWWSEKGSRVAMGDDKKPDPRQEGTQRNSMVRHRELHTQPLNNTTRVSPKDSFLELWQSLVGIRLHVLVIGKSIDRDQIYGMKWKICYKLNSFPFSNGHQESCIRSNFKTSSLKLLH